MKKEDLLKKLRENTSQEFDLPEIKVNAITYPDVIKQYIAMSKEVGCNVIEIDKTEDVNATIHKIYPDAKVYCSNVKGIKANINPDTVKDATCLDGVDVGIVKGEIAVAENGCVWIPQTMKERAVCFISEALVIIIDKEKVVNNMHEAYKKIEMPSYGFGTFISGPSKTADIEQALVMGAQAAKDVTILIRA
nr:LUD domain-containing protein [uncultured Prevotella sp.]